MYDFDLQAEEMCSGKKKDKQAKQVGKRLCS